MQTFSKYALSSPLKEALDKLGYAKPMPVQAAVLDHFSTGKDLIVEAQTGSGKTLAFALPICEEVDWEAHAPQALVLTPTRELAVQIQEGFFKIGRFKRIKAVGVYGKAPFAIQQKELKQKTHVVVATPGRLLDHIERGTIPLEEVRYLVIDEADEMLRMGFIEEVTKIVESLSQNRQTLLFSATMPSEIIALAQKLMKQPTMELKITPEKVVSDQVEVKAYQVEAEKKDQALMDLTKVLQPECCMIFCNRKVTVEAVYERLTKAGYVCSRLHGDLGQKERFKIMEAFKKGEYRYLICTDVAARGIDVKHVTYVISYDVPEDKEQYVHRMGRTGRGDQTGQAALLATDQEKKYVAAIEAYIEEPLVWEQLPTEAEVKAHEEAFNAQMHKPLAVKALLKQEAIHEGIMKLHINAGKKTKMRPVDVVGTLCHLKGMEAKDIGIIEIQDISTYVEILNGKGEAVYKMLQNTPIKGRLRKVSKVDGRSQKKDSI